MGIVYFLIFLIAAAVVGLFVYKRFVRDTKLVEAAFDTFIIKDGFKWKNSADQDFPTLRHRISSSTLDAFGQAVEIKQMIYRDFGRFTIYLSDISVANPKVAEKMGANVGLNKINLYVNKEIRTDETLEIHRHQTSVNIDEVTKEHGTHAITGGLIPKFGSMFTVYGLNVKEKSLLLNEDLQNIIMVHQNHYPLTGDWKECRIYLDKAGIFITGVRNWNNEDLKHLFELGKDMAEKFGIAAM